MDARFAIPDHICRCAFILDLALVELHNAFEQHGIGNNKGCKIRRDLMGRNHGCVVKIRLRNSALVKRERDFGACFQFIRNCEVQRRNRRLLSDRNPFRSQSEAKLACFLVVDERHIESVVLLHLHKCNLCGIIGQCESQREERILDRSVQEEVNFQAVRCRVLVHIAALNHKREIRVVRRGEGDKREHHHERKEHCQQFLHRFYSSC